MGNVFIEARPKARPEGSAIDDYVIEDHADHVLHTSQSQQEAIEWAKKQGPCTSRRSCPASQRQEKA